jgi:cellulose synthase/poly-beta-1,6-N-acetylglucosamine synthase-like glycosyltransferase
MLIYSYFLYPLVLLCLPARRKMQDRESASYAKWPLVSLLLAAHNEERVITEKIRNFLGCDYPGPREMVIVSDGSDDRTLELAASSGDPCVRVISQRERTGKGAAVNRAVAQANGEILVFTDANAFFEKQTLIELLRPFSDSSVGLVTGCTRYTEGTIGSLYQRYEQALKVLEALGGVVATADGAVYAMRRSLWREHDPGLINDFYHPMLVSLQGQAALIAPKAVCVEDFIADNEFRRQARMVSQASFVYLKLLPRLIRARRWRSVLVLSSHKLLRWLTIPLLLLMAGTSLWLARSGGLYRLAVAGELMFVLLVALGALAKRHGLNEKLTIAYQFVALNCAGALGLWRCLTGAVPVVWQPRGE